MLLSGADVHDVAGVGGAAADNVKCLQVLAERRMTCVQRYQRGNPRLLDMTVVKMTMGKMLVCTKVEVHSENCHNLFRTCVNFLL